MKELSLVLNKPVVALDTADVTGILCNAYFDELCKNIAYFDVQTKSENLLLPIDKCIALSDCVLISSKSDCIKTDAVDLSTLTYGLIGKEIFAYNGNRKGKVSDVIFSPSGKVGKISYGDGDITPSLISQAGDVILLKNSKPQKSRSKKMPRPKEDYPVELFENFDVAEPSELPTENSFEHNSDVKPDLLAQSPRPAVSLNSGEPVLSQGAFAVLLEGSNDYAYDEDAHTPTRVICDYDFLLGRTLGANLCTYLGELIGKEGDVVTDEIVAKARRAGKLVELTLTSVKKDA